MAIYACMAFSQKKTHPYIQKKCTCNIVDTFSQQKNLMYINKVIKCILSKYENEFNARMIILINYGWSITVMYMYLYFEVQITKLNFNLTKLSRRWDQCHIPCVCRSTFWVKITCTFCIIVYLVWGGGDIKLAIYKMYIRWS